MKTVTINQPNIDAFSLQIDESGSEHRVKQYTLTIDAHRCKLTVKPPLLNGKMLADPLNIEEMCRERRPKLQQLLQMPHQFIIEIEGPGQATFNRRLEEVKPHYAYLFREVENGIHPMLHHSMFRPDHLSRPLPQFDPKEQLAMCTEGFHAALDEFLGGIRR